MNKSDSIVKLSVALLKAQRLMGGAVKGAANPFFKSKYADYGSVLEVSKEPLNEAGIIVLQPTLVRDGKTLVETTLIHAESGEYLSSDIEVVCAKQNDPQAYGSAITYARRYSLQSLLSIPSEDDDGNSASGKATKPTLAAVAASSNSTAPQLASTLAGPMGSGSNTPAKPNSWRKPKPSGADATPVVGAVAIPAAQEY